VCVAVGVTVCVAVSDLSRADFKSLSVLQCVAVCVAVGVAACVAVSDLSLL